MCQHVFIYGLIDPRDGEVKYVGKTKNLQERLKTHIKEARRTNTPKNAWILSLRRLGMRPEIGVLEEVLEEEWEYYEQWWIAFFRQQGLLKNMCDGGAGRNAPLSEETKQKLCQVMGRPVKEITRIKISEAHRGRKHSPEAKARMRQAALGRIVSEETRLKRSASGKGKPKSLEHRQRIGQAHKGQSKSLEAREKMRASKVGWKPSEALCAIVREKNRGEGNGRAKLTAEQVLEIRRKYCPGIVSLPSLAREYGIDTGVVFRIIKRQSWKHL